MYSKTVYGFVMFSIQHSNYFSMLFSCSYLPGNGRGGTNFFLCISFEGMIKSSCLHTNLSFLEFTTRHRELSSTHFRLPSAVSVRTTGQGGERQCSIDHQFRQKIKF